MTLQEKMNWFWTIGEVPSTIFDDLNDQKPKVLGRPRRRQVKRLQPSSWKQHEEPLKPSGATIDLGRRI